MGMPRSAVARLRPLLVLVVVLGAGAGALTVPELRQRIEPGARSFRKATSELKREAFDVEFPAAPGGGAPALTLRKAAGESVEHVLMKALLWGMYREEYPGLEVERELEGERFKPDLLALDAATGAPAFWAECGKTDLNKIVAVAGRHPGKLFVVAKYRIQLQGYAASVARELQRTRPRPGGGVLLVAFPDDSLDRYFDDAGVMCIERADAGLQWARVGSGA